MRPSLRLLSLMLFATVVAVGLGATANRSLATERFNPLGDFVSASVMRLDLAVDGAHYFQSPAVDNQNYNATFTRLGWAYNTSPSSVRERVAYRLNDWNFLQSNVCVSATDTLTRYNRAVLDVGQVCSPGGSFIASATRSTDTCAGGKSPGDQYHSSRDIELNFAHENNPIGLKGYRSQIGAFSGCYVIKWEYGIQ